MKVKLFGYQTEKDSIDLDGLLSLLETRYGYSDGTHRQSRFLVEERKDVYQVYISEDKAKVCISTVTLLPSGDEAVETELEAKVNVIKRD